MQDHVTTRKTTGERSDPRIWLFARAEGSMIGVRVPCAEGVGWRLRQPGNLIHRGTCKFWDSPLLQHPLTDGRLQRQQT